MRRLFFIAVVTLTFFKANAQKVFSVDQAYKADIKVFVVDNNYKADLLVYKVDAAYKVGKNDGKWFFTDQAYKASKKIYFVDAAYKADLKFSSWMLHIKQNGKINLKFTYFTKLLFKYIKQLLNKTCFMY